MFANNYFANNCFANNCFANQSSYYGFQEYDNSQYYDVEACMPVSKPKIELAKPKLIEFPKVTINTLYIPNISDYSVSDIRNIFTKYAIAMVKDVDFVIKMNYDTFRVQRSAYIHIDYWFYSRVSANFVERLETFREARLVVNDPEYWTILPSTAKKHTANGRKLKIDLDSECDLPPIVNIHVTDEYSAYEYEQQRLITSSTNSYSNSYHTPETDYAEVPFESHATSCLDTLDIGLRRDDEMFDMHSIQEYRKERMNNRMRNCMY